MPIKSITLIAFLACTVAAIQMHGITFWTEYVTGGVLILGAGLSLLLEGCAIYLWSRRRNFLAAITTVLLLAGPMAHLGLPVYSDIQSHSAGQSVDAQALATIETRIDAANATRDTYLANSTERPGWGEYVEKQEKRIDGLISERADLLTATAGTPIQWQDYLPVGMFALALIIFQIVNIAIIRELSRPTPKPEPEAEEADEPAEIALPDFGTVKDDDRNADVIRLDLTARGFDRPGQNGTDIRGLI